MNAYSQAVRAFGHPVSNDPREMLFNCPRCSKPKLYVNMTTGAFVCFSCNHRGCVLKGKKQYGIQLDFGGPRKLLPPSLDEIDATPVRRGSVFQYLVRRGFTREQMATFDIRQSSFRGELNIKVVDSISNEVVGTQKKYIDVRSAAIFPIYDGGYQGYQSRNLYPKDKNHRWMSAPGTPRRKLLFNADIALNPANKVVYIAEGIPAACAFGFRGIATFGKGFSMEQFERLMKSHQKLFYVAYDGDAQFETYKLALQLLEIGRSVKVIQFKGKEDPDSVSDLATRIENAFDLNYDDAIRQLHTRAFDPMQMLLKGRV